MKKSTRKKIVIAIGILAIIIVIGLIVIGANCWKNRWHKIDFTVDSISVTHVSDQYTGADRCRVTVKGNARAWFYDFNKYEFVLADGTNGQPYANTVETSGRMVVNNRGETPFEITFTTDNAEQIKHRVFIATDILEDGKSSGADIRLFMNDYADMIPNE